MKTIEERAQEIADEAFDDWCFDKATKQYKGAFDRDECAAIIRADREAVLRRVEDVLCSGNYEAIGAYQKLVQEVIRYLIDAVKKEALE